MEKVFLPDSKIEVVDKRYAIIFIDHEGESLNEFDEFFCPKPLRTFYYQHPNDFLQWNMYLIVPTHFFEDEKILENVRYHRSDDITAKSLKKNFIEDHNYVRKIILNKENIDKYIAYQYPDLPKQDTRRQVVAIKGRNYKESIIQAKRYQETDYPDYKIIPSFYRDLNALDTLFKLDNLRRDMIKNPEIKLLFHTHINLEYQFYRYKFLLILSDPEPREKDFIRIDDENFKPNPKIK